VITESEQKVYSTLENLNIDYKRYEHPPVFTVDEAKQYWQDIEGIHSKNLFLRNIGTAFDGAPGLRNRSGFTLWVD